MPLTVAQAAMPPVEVSIENYTPGYFLVRVAGNIVNYAMEDSGEVHTFYRAVVIGIEAAGRRANVTGLEHLK